MKVRECDRCRRGVVHGGFPVGREWLCGQCAGARPENAPKRLTGQLQADAKEPEQRAPRLSH